MIDALKSRAKLVNELEALRRRQAEYERRVTRLKKEVERCEAIVDMTFDLAYECRLGADGEVTCRVFRGAWKQLTGYTGEELKERGGWEMLLHPDDRDRAGRLAVRVRGGVSARRTRFA